MILAVLLAAIACFFTSCDAEQAAPKADEGMAYVIFGNGGSRSLNTEYGIQNYNDLFWYYKAEKKDGYGITGTAENEPVSKNEAGEHIKGLSGRVGPFSQGLWQFTLFAKDGNGNLVYEGTSAVVNLKGSETKSVPVAVSLQGDYGSLDFKDANFQWHKDTPTQEVGDGDVYLRINISGEADMKDENGDKIQVNETVIKMVAASNGYKITDDLDFGYGYGVFPAGYYTCTVQAYVEEDLNEAMNAVEPDASYKASQVFGLRVYGNAITKIKDYLEEGSFADVIFGAEEQDMVVFVPNNDGSATIENISVTPSGTEGKKTSVTFSDGALYGLPSGITLQLDVKVIPVESANEKFDIIGTTTDNRSAFAGIDITLTKTTAEGNTVPIEFSSDAIVTTYIASGLSNVSVVYNGNDGKPHPTCNSGVDISKPSNEADVFENDAAMGTGLGYSKESGKLVFKTSHFSEYYVIAEPVAVNVNKNIAYNNLVVAVAKANAGDTIKVYKDVKLEAALEIKKSLTLVGIDGIDEEKISIASDPDSNADRVININDNTEPISLILDNLDIVGPTTGTYTRGISAYNNSKKLYLELNRCNVSASYYAINIAGDNHEVEVSVRNSYIVGWCAAQSWTPDAKFTFENCTLIGNNDKGYNAEGWNDFATIVINEDVVNNEFIFRNCRIEANQTTGNDQDLLSIRSKSDTVILDGCTFYANRAEIEDLVGYITSYYDDPKLTINGKSVQFGYKIDGEYDILPFGPSEGPESDVWTVNPKNVQYVLDGAYGSIDGKTIVLSEGTYPKLEFARATKYKGSNTDYYIGGISEEKKKSFAEYYAIKNSGQWSGSAYYDRSISNVTLRAAEGATVTIPGIVASSGHCYGSVYDFVLDKAYTAGSAYYLSHKISNVRFENLHFTSKVEFDTSSADTVIDGVTFSECSFTTGGTSQANGQALRYYNESNNGKVRNLTVDSCAFNACFQGVYTQKINGITVNNSSFDTTGHNAIAIQSGDAINHKAVVITGNTFANIGDRIIRFGNVGADTQITIMNNSATNSGDSNGEVIKAQSLAEGVAYNISGNNWGAGRKVANTEFKDSNS